MNASRRALLLIFVVVFVDLLGFGIVLPLLPRYGERLGAGGATLGALMASFSAMQFLFTPVWGRLSDRVGRRPVLLLGLAGSVVFYALFGIASRIESLLLLFVARIGAGVSGATIATAQAYIADSTPPEGRSKGMALIGAAFGIGFTFGPLLGALALVVEPGAIPPPAALEAPAAPTLAIGGGPGTLSPMPGYLASAICGLSFCLAVFMLPESLREGSRAPRHDWFDRTSLRAALSAPSIAGLIGLFFVATVAFAMFESTLALVSSSVFQMSDRENFYLFAFTGFMLILAQGVVVRRLSGRIADESMTRLGVAMLSVAVLGLAGAVHLRAMWLLFAMLVLAVQGFALTTTSLQALVSKRSRMDQQGGVLGVNQSASAMARILGPLAGISLFDVGPAAPYLASAALLFVCALALRGVLVAR